MQPKYKVLHVGCGRQSWANLPPAIQRDRWEQIRVDADPAVQPDVVAILPDLSMVESGSIDCVFSKHNIEHLFRHEATQCLAEFHRVLRPTGFLILQTPDLHAMAELLLAKDPEETLYVASVYGDPIPITPLDMLFGSEHYISRGNHWMAHKTAFTQQTLERALTKAGFEGVRVFSRKDKFELVANCRKVVRDNLMGRL